MIARIWYKVCWAILILYAVIYVTRFEAEGWMRIFGADYIANILTPATNSP